MERLNWALLGLMGVVTALGLTTSSGAGKTKADLAGIEGNFPEVKACCPIGGVHPNDATIEVATSVPATSHAGCSACQAKKAASPKDTATSAPSSNAFDELVAMIQSTVTPTTGNLVSGEPCPGNCQASGVCCDKSSSKSEINVASVPFVHDTKIVCEGACPAETKAQVAASLANLQKLAQSKGVYFSAAELQMVFSPLEKQPATVAAATDQCPLTKAAEMIENLTRNFVCEGGECLTKQGHGTLIITAVDPAAKPDMTAKPEGLLNLLAASEASKQDEPQRTLTILALPDGKYAATMDFTKSGEGLKANEAAPDNAPGFNVPAGMKIEIKPAETKPSADNSRAAARAAKLAKIEAKMEEPWMWEFERVNIEELAQIIRVNVGVPVFIDRRALEEAAYDTASHIKVTKQPELESGDYLRGLLEDQVLTWKIPASNDRVLITTRTAEENTCISRVYDVTDLITDSDDSKNEIIENITSLIQPTTWKTNGGSGDLSIRKTSNRMHLACRNTYWIQREVIDLLDDLRLGIPAQNQGQAAIQQPIDETVAVLRRYELPTQPDVKDPLDRHKMIQNYQAFLLKVLGDLPEFKPEIFIAIEYNLRPVLVTKQVPHVHQKIKQTLKDLEVRNVGFF